MTKLYPYIGSSTIADAWREAPPGRVLETPQDVLALYGEHGMRRGELVVTFVVVDDRIRMADRHSEHVACAQGRDVASAGELTWYLEAGQPEVVAVSNQSTGYCPEPSSWPAVASALERAGIEAPQGWTWSFAFRRCTQCGTLQIVKDEAWHCIDCGADLPRDYNLP